MVDIFCCVDVVFFLDKVDFLFFDGDLNGFGVGYVGIVVFDVFCDDLEIFVFGFG